MSVPYREAFLCFERGQYEDAKKHIEIALQDESTDPASFGNALLLLANTHAALEEFESAEATYKTCFGYLEEHMGSGYLGLATVLLNHALLYCNEFPTSDDRIVETALQLLFRAQRLLENTFDVDRLTLADVFENIGCCHEQRGKYTEALACYTRSLRIREKFQDSKGETELDICSTLHNIAMLHRLNGKCDKALPLLETIVRCRRKHLGPRDEDYVEALFHLGLVAKEMRKKRQAETALLKAYFIRLETKGHDHPDTVLTLQYLDVDDPGVLRALDQSLAMELEDADNQDQDQQEGVVVGRGELQQERRRGSHARVNGRGGKGLGVHQDSRRSSSQQSTTSSARNGVPPTTSTKNIDVTATATHTRSTTQTTERLERHTTTQSTAMASLPTPYSSLPPRPTSTTTDRPPSRGGGGGSGTGVGGGSMTSANSSVDIYVESE